MTAQLRVAKNTLHKCVQKNLYIKFLKKTTHHRISCRKVVFCNELEILPGVVTKNSYLFCKASQETTIDIR